MTWNERNILYSQYNSLLGNIWDSIQLQEHTSDRSLNTKAPLGTLSMCHAADHCQENTHSKHPFWNGHMLSAPHLRAGSKEYTDHQHPLQKLPSLPHTSRSPWLPKTFSEHCFRKDGDGKRTISVAKKNRQWSEKSIL